MLFRVSSINHKLIYVELKNNQKAHRCRALLFVSIAELTIAGRGLAGYHCIVTRRCPALKRQCWKLLTKLGTKSVGLLKSSMGDIRSCLGAAGNAANIPPREVLDWLGVHVRLFAGSVDAPHVHHALDL